MARLVKGDKFPDFKVNNILGNELKEGLTIKEITGGKPTMFWFLRYMGCPPCRLDVHLLTMKKPEFDAKGVNIVVVMQSKPEIVQRDMIDKTLPFHLICDTQQELYKTLELGERKPGWRDTMTEEDKKKQQYKAEILNEMGIGMRKDRLALGCSVTKEIDRLLSQGLSESIRINNHGLYLADRG